MRLRREPDRRQHVLLDQAVDRARLIPSMAAARVAETRIAWSCMGMVVGITSLYRADRGKRCREGSSRGYPAPVQPKTFEQRVQEAAAKAGTTVTVVAS
jgi:hypothetical protein